MLDIHREELTQTMRKRKCPNCKKPLIRCDEGDFQGKECVDDKCRYKKTFRV